MKNGQELTAFPTSILSDALERLGLRGAVSGLAPLVGGPRIAGPAVTVKLGPAGKKPAPVHLGAAAIRLAEPGSIIVVDNAGDKEAACWGGLLTLAAKMRGVAGILVDGLVRDIEEIRGQQMPLTALGVTPLTARGRYQELGTNLPVNIGGVAVFPGDTAVIDQTGAVIIPRHRLAEVLSEARAIARIEQGFEASLARGEDPVSVLGQRYETMLSGGRP